MGRSRAEISTVAVTVERRRSISSTTPAQARDSSKPSGRSNSSSVTSGRDDPVDPERALPALGPRQQVPDVVLVHQPPGLDQPLGVLAVAAARVPEPDPAPAHGGALQDADQLGPFLLRLAPAGGIDDHRAGRGLGLLPERLRQRPQQLAQRGPELGRVGRGRPGEQEQRLGLVRGEPGQIGTSAAQQRPATTAPRLRVDGDARGGQRFQVPPSGGHRHLQLLGQLGGGHPAARLHEQQRRHQSVSSHAPILRAEVLTG
ncbi:hypothetical protein GCM10020220_114270 [Nonomuraea rubra]